MNNTPTGKETSKYKLNFNASVTAVRQFLKKIIQEDVLLQVLKKFLTPLRPGRSFIRNIKPKSSIPLSYKAA